MRATLITTLLITLSIAGRAQFHYTFTSVPDPAVVRVNGVERCQTPCEVRYFWREAVVMTPGGTRSRKTISI